MSNFPVLNVGVCLTRWALVPTLWFALAIGVGDLRCFAQTAAVAQVSGIVQDPSGAPVAGAQVKITQIETKLVRQITSDDQGRYLAPALPVGPYQLEVTAAGFKTYLQSGIVLQVGNNIDVNVSLQIGTAAERVDVTAQVNMVETRDSAVSQVIDERRILELPLNGRQLTQLILLSGAAITTPGGDLNSSKNIYSSTTISVAGGQANSVNYMLDGADNNDAFTNVNLPIPFPDALQEFSVQTNGMTARYGLHPAAVVNAVTKSGTNDWHGSAFEFLRNGDVNARNFFAPVHDSLKRNQFGGTFGGRIIRDKLFFFGGFQGTFNRSNPPQLIAFVPTAAVLNNGDFSTIDGPGCISGGKGKSVIDPTTGLPFPNNQIPVGRFNPVSLALVKAFPAAQNGCGKVTYGIPTTGDDDQEIVRMDWVQSSKHTLFGRYYIVDYRNPAASVANPLTTTQSGNLERAQSATLGDTYAFSPTLLNSAHLTFTRRRNDRGPAPDAINLDTKTFGIKDSTLGPNYLVATVSGYFSVGCSACKPSFYNVNSFSFGDDVDIVRGKHQMAFGVTLIRNQLNAKQFQIGIYAFNGAYATGKSTDALAAFMLGVMSDFNQGDVVQNATRQTVLGFYAQDSIRLTTRLTVNAGLRWDPMLAPHDYYNRCASFSQANFNAGIRSTVFTNAPAGALFYGDPGVAKGCQNNHLAQFSPRLGIVWDPTGSGRQSIRISGTILRDTQDLWYTQRQIAANPPNGIVLDRPFPFPAGTFSNPWGGYPGGSPFPLPSPVPSNFVFPSPGTYAVIPPDLKPQYMAQWSVSYQRQITPNWLASASYLGNKTTNVNVGQSINPAVYIPGSTVNPNLRRVLYLQNPALGAAYGQITQADPNGNANYNALLLSIQHRFSHGFTWLTNYTWSHCLSDVDHTGQVFNPEYEQPNNRAADYGNCNFDVRHVMNTSLIAISPVKGNGLAGRIFGQWQLAPIVSMRSGLPMNILDGADISQIGGLATRSLWSLCWTGPI